MSSRDRRVMTHLLTDVLKLLADVFVSLTLERIERLGRAVSRAGILSCTETRNEHHPPLRVRFPIGLHK